MAARYPPPVMQVGLIGAGNMASALARGWGDPVLVTDSGSGRATALAAEVGGVALSSYAVLAQRADLVFLAMKPAGLPAVAQEIAPHARAVVSLLARTSLEQLRAALSGVPVWRVEPNTPVELGAGVLPFGVDAEPADPELDRAVRELFGRVGTVIDVPEHLMPVAAAVSAVGPAYVALVAEAWADSALKRGMPAAMAAELVTATLAGTAKLLASRNNDTLAVRRGVASPGGTTIRGLAALERGGIRAAFFEATDDVVGT